MTACSDETADGCAAPENLSGLITNKVFLFLADPQATLDAGYDRITVDKSKDGVLGPYKPKLKLKDGLVIRPGVYNYVYIDELGEPGAFYRPFLADSTEVKTPVPQEDRQGSDTTFEQVLSITELRRIYLFGVDLTGDDAAPFPLEMFAHYIRQAIDQVEHMLDIYLLPRKIIERHDFYRRDYESYGFLKLNTKPCISVQEVSLEYPLDTKVVVFPADWVRLDRHAGQVHLLPARGTFTQSLVSAGGGYLPLVFGGADFIPDLWRVEYFAGFELGKVPPVIKEVVGMYAALGGLNLAGDLLAGAGVASKSLSIDGLSSSVSTTSSPEFSGYGSRILEYTRALKDKMPALHRFYHGGRMSVTS